MVVFVTNIIPNIDLALWSAPWAICENFSEHGLFAAFVQNDSSINVAALVKNNVIQIDSAELKHSGTYECTAANGYGDPVVGFITVSILGECH